MRLRNVKNADKILEESPLVVLENPFDDSRELRIEIGTGKGDFIIGIARKHPNVNFIGIEKYPSVLVRALEKLEDIPDNLRFMCIDAKNIEEYFDHNVSVIYLNFSDPWPKTRHEKRRLTSDSFLKSYEKISKECVHIKQKTDNKGLFAYSLVSLNNAGYHFNDVCLDLTNSDIDNVQSEYEKKFVALGETINYLDAEKKLPNSK
ncbi:MAG: tRNA (guanosine(46)-N7)-methyltransferase TrmB [bacterium]|nr:tRNA (guanosine(46)-N7)-methyltransferase TrmB [bacterium]